LKVAVAACPEELPGQLKKLLTVCELRKFFDKRAKVRKVYGSADLLLNPLIVQCPICAAVVSLGHFNDTMIKRDNLWQHIKSSHPSWKTSLSKLMVIGNIQRFHPFAIRTDLPRDEHILITNPVVGVIYLCTLSADYTALTICRTIKSADIFHLA